MQNSLFSSHGCQLLLTWHGTSNFEVFCDGLKNVYFKLLTKWQASTLVVLFLDFSHSFLNLTSMAWNEIVLILNWGFIPFLRSFAIEFNILLWKQVPQFEILAKELTLGILPMYNIMITYFVCSRVEMYPLWVRPYLLFWYRISVKRFSACKAEKYVLNMVHVLILWCDGFMHNHYRCCGPNFIFVGSTYCTK